MTRRLVGVVVLALGAVLTMPSFAVPGTCCVEQVTDPQDVAGKLDLALLRYAKSGPNAPMKITVQTHEGWPPRVLRPNVNRLRVLIDRNEDGTVDFRATIRRVEGELKVFIHGPGSSFEPLPARKPNPRTVRFTIPGSSPPNPGGFVDLAAISRFIESPPCDPASGGTACVDRAPNSGWL
jgi:hypothetical protein